MTVAAGYFDDMYAASADPWGLASRWYETRKYAVSVALLPAERYRAAFEPGCSVGVLTAALAERCDRVLACDGAAAAVRSASARTRCLPHVQVERRAIPREWPLGRFDLVVFSEILYYFDSADLREVLDLGTGALQRGGTLLAVHWRRRVPDYPRSGDEVHELLAEQRGLARLAEHRDKDFVAEVYIRSDATPPSVAECGGLV